jgi:sterol desaturase/sphingolipid hydroxylase (fatty acid hydroxylase superfamily)
MHIFSSLKTLTDTLQESFFLSVRFFLFAGSIFLFFYVWKKRKYWHLKIQQRFPGKEHILREIRYSFYTVFIFGIVIAQVAWASKERWTLIYYPIDKYGYPYYFFSIILMIFVHDAYFYWTHRLLHWKPLFKHVHKVHHLSLNPTPFSSYAFHPVEALVEIGIIPLLVFTIPYHVSAICIFSVYTLVMNVLGHMGYEFFPKGFASHKIFKWHNTPTNHNMHHRYVKCNYGLYFNIWDRVLKTNHARYEEVFEEVVAQRSSKILETIDAATVKGDVEAIEAETAIALNR